MKQRIITSIAIIAAIIPIFIFKSYFIGVLLFVAVLASFELNDLIANKKYPILMIATFSLIILFGLDIITEDKKLAIAAIFLVLFAFLDLIYNEIKFNDLAVVYTISLLLGFALSAILYLHNIDILLMAFVIIVNYASDIGAYLVGSRFGKTKLAPKISPNKTVEGSLGGIAFSAILGISFGLMFLSDYMSLPKMIIISLFIPIISQLGDLFFSSLKRTFNKKDFGSIFPGHGGVLDRIDSLIFSLLFMIIFIRLGYLGVILWKR